MNRSFSHSTNKINIKKQQSQLLLKRQSCRKTKFFDENEDVDIKVNENGDSIIPRKRGGQGVTAMNTQAVCSALSVEQTSEVLMITSRGQAVRCPVLNIRETNRGSKGVKLVNLDKKDELVGIEEVIELNEDEESAITESSDGTNNIPLENNEELINSN